MPSDRSKIDYAKSVLRRSYSSAPILAGPLIAGKVYQLARFAAGDDFTNVGAALPVSSCGFSGSAVFSGLIFTATGTAPTTWANGSRLVELRLDELKQYAVLGFLEASDPVTLTTTSSEGASAGGQVTSDPALRGIAVEELIAEWDPDYLEPSYQPRGRPWGVTVSLG